MQSKRWRSGLDLDEAVKTFAEDGIGGIEGGEVEVHGSWVGLYVCSLRCFFVWSKSATER